MHVIVVPVQMLQQGFEGRPVNFWQALDKRGVFLHSLPLVLFICGIHTHSHPPMKKVLEAQQEVIFYLNIVGFFFWFVFHTLQLKMKKCSK